MYQQYITEAVQFHIDGKSYVEIHSILLGYGLSESEVSDIIYETQKSYNRKVRMRGCIMAGIGIVILLTSFIILLSLDYNNPYFSYVLYGFNTVGIVLVFAGMIKILGW